MFSAFLKLVLHGKHKKFENINLYIGMILNMTEQKTQPELDKHFTEKALDAASSLANPSKINLSFIPQAFKLRKNVSWSTFLAFVILFFWVSVIGLVL